MNRVPSILAVGVLLFLGACKKEEVADPTPPAAPPPAAEDISITGVQGARLFIDGVPVRINEGGDTLSIFFTDGVLNEPPALSRRYYAVSLHNGTLDVPVFRMRIGTLAYIGPQVLSDEFWAFFDPGARTYGPATAGGNGVEIAWRDANGVTWTSECGSSDQSGSALNITEVVTAQDKLGPIARVKATFNCTLYDCATGATRTLTNGVVVLDFRDF